MESYQYRYFRSKDNNGEPLFWPGSQDGHPFRGQMPPDLTQEEYDQLVTVHDSRTRILDLSKQEDLDFYNMIVDQQAKNISVIRKELIEPTATAWRVLLQWYDLSSQMAPRDKF